jgi:hypothetical protein
MDVSVKCDQSGRNLQFSVAGDRTVAQVLRVAAAGHHLLGENGIDDLQLRREGEDQPLDQDARAEDVLTDGDRLIVDVSAASAAAATQRESEHAELSSAAGKIAGESISMSPRQFLTEARQLNGE